MTQNTVHTHNTQLSTKTMPNHTHNLFTKHPHQHHPTDLRNQTPIHQPTRLEPQQETTTLIEHKTNHILNHHNPTQKKTTKSRHASMFVNNPMYPRSYVNTSICCVKCLQLTTWQQLNTCTAKQCSSIRSKSTNDKIPEHYIDHPIPKHCLHVGCIQHNPWLASTTCLLSVQVWCSTSVSEKTIPTTATSPYIPQQKHSIQTRKP